MTSKPLVVFGNKELAEVAAYYFDNDTDRSIAAFTVDGTQMTEQSFLGKPLVPFEDVAEYYPPSGHDFFVAVGYSRINALRREKCEKAQLLGYTLASYVSSHATVLSSSAVGWNCFILEDNTIQPFVSIGNGVTLWSGNHIGHHATIGDFVFLTSHVVVSGGVTIGARSFIGVNATLRDHIEIGECCVIGAGSLIVANAEPYGVYTCPAAERSRVPSSRLKKI